MSEKQLLISISRLSHAPGNLAEAIRQIHVLFERDLNGQVLLPVQTNMVPSNTEALKDAMDSQADRFFSERPELPIHLVHSVPLRAGGRALGRLTVFFAATSALDVDLLRRVVTFTGEQLGMRLERNRLLNIRTRLRKKVAKIKKHLAERKAVQRAEGILVARWGIDLSAAGLWILRQADCTGRSVLEVATKVCDEGLAQKEGDSVAALSLPPGSFTGQTESWARRLGRGRPSHEWAPTTDAPLFPYKRDNNPAEDNRLPQKYHDS